MIKSRNAVVAVILATVALGGLASSGAAWAEEKKPATQTSTAASDTCKGSKVRTACLQAAAVTAFVKG